ncbi:MAG: maltose O-acetyltransferase [Colwellia sp.]|jgi:maltose O-acetyltransferase
MNQFTIKTLPKTKKSLQISRLLKLMEIPFIRRFFFKKLEAIVNENGCNIKFSNGFYCRYGNIYASNVDLNDTFCLDYDNIIIGDNTSFSFQNVIITSTHDSAGFDKIITKPVVIGKNCWITTRVIILPGVTIGDNVTIGAGSVVTKDIPSNTFAAGNPAKVIKIKN